MPVAGFKVGDLVLTPTGRTGRVEKVTRSGGQVGTEYVQVVLEADVTGRPRKRVFRAAALRWAKS